MPRPLTCLLMALLLMLSAATLLFGQMRADSPEPLSSPAGGLMPRLEALVASPLVSVVEEVAADLRRAGALDVHIETGSTEYLLTRLGRSTAGADLILLESREAVALLLRSGLAQAPDFVTQASDRLAVAVREEDRDRAPFPFLAEISPGRILIANPDTTMSGLHAKQSLTRVGFWEKISFKVRHAPDDAAIVRELRQTTADAAVMYLSAVTQSPGLVSILTLPKDSHFAILYFGAPLQTSPRQELARDFLRRLASPLSRDAWMRGGFHPAPDALP